MQLAALFCWLAFIATSVTAENPNPPAEADNTSLNYRLPNKTYPEHYNISITTIVHTGEKSFHGEVIIDIVVAKATTNIVLHSLELDISKVSIARESTEWEELSYESKGELLTLKFINGTEFAAGSRWKLAFSYNGQLRDDQKGIILHKYIGDEGKNHYIAIAQLDMKNARYTFPCYDEPDKIANFTITINHSPSYTAISNMPVNQNMSSAGKTVFLTTAPVSVTTVAFVVSDLEYIEGVFNGVRHRFYSRPSMKTELKWPFIYSMLTLDYVSKYTDVEFMLPKLDSIVVPDYDSYGMGSLGLIMYSERYFYYNKFNSGASDLQFSARSTASLIAGQWFGNSYFIHWWNYLWQPSGLLNLFSFKALDNIYPELGMRQHFHQLWYQQALLIEATDNIKPLSYYVMGPDELVTEYERKATCVLLMWNHALTDKVFQKGIQSFLKNNLYGAVGEQELFTAIQNATDEEGFGLSTKVEQMMSTWTHQSGYPLLTITRNYENGTFNIKQEPFVAGKSVTDVKSWHIPINFAVASNPDFRDTKATHYLLNVNESIVDASINKRDWLVVNKQSTGFYRVKYDEENYNLITECLIQRPFVIHYRNRAQLLSDAYHLTISNRLDYSILLNMLTYLKKEDQSLPWITAAEILRELSRYLEENDDYKLFVAELVGPMFKKLGVDEMPGELLNDKMTRFHIMSIACQAGVEECLVKTNNKLKALIRENIPVEPYLTWAIKVFGLIQSGDEEFDFFYQQLLNSTESLRRDLIEVLAFSRNKTHLRKLFNSSIDMSNKFTIQDRVDVFILTSSNSETGLLAGIEFLNENWKAYGSLKDNKDSRYPLFRVIRKMAKYAVSKNTSKKLLDLAAKVKITHPSALSVNNTMARKANWFKERIEPVKLWIAEYYATHRNESCSNERTV